ncbi:MAG: ATP-binding protein [Candidatus Zixiibacteriota bacterium]
MFQTIRGKITILYVLIFGLTLAACSVILYTTFARKLRADFDESLITIASSLAESVHEDGIVPQEIFQDVADDYSSFGYGDKLYIEILNKDESIALKSPQLGDAALPLGSETLDKGFLGKSIFATIKLQLPSPSHKRITARLLLHPGVANAAPQYVFAIAMPTRKMEHVLFRLRLIIFTLVPFAMVVTAIGGWFLSNRAFKPINQVISATRTITAERLHERLTVSSVDDEINRLSTTLNEMIERLEQSFRAQKQFTADASHELRTPLTILAGETEVALQRCRTTDEYQQTLQSNLEEIRRLQKIVNALLLLSQIDSGKMTIDRNPIRLDELFMAAIQKISQVAQTRGIMIDLQLGDSCDEDSQEIMVMADSASLQNAFLNLLENAIKFSHEETKIFCTLKAVNGWAEITVTDNGEGILVEHLEHIFDRFFRVDHSQGRTEKSGAGLGLAIAKAVIEAHGGTISLKSSPEQGTTVRVLLPIADKGI